MKSENQNKVDYRNNSKDTSKGIVWTGPKIKPTKNTKIDPVPGSDYIANGKFRVGASVHIDFDEELDTKA
jgi:hypothetical protein